MDLTPEPFLPLARRHRAIFFDSYGVLRAASGPLPGAREALETLAAAGIPAFVITNDASKDVATQAAPYEGALDPERIISAGLLAERHLAEHHAGAQVATLGPPGCEGVLARAGVTTLPFPDLDEAALARVDAVALLDEAGWDWLRELTRLVNLLRNRPDLPWLAPNPDLIFPTGAGDVGLAAGSLANLVAAASGRPPLRFGKPDLTPYEAGLAAARELLPDLAPHQVLMIGDTLETDIRGAQPLGLRTALITTGNTSAAQVQAEIDRTGIQPDHLLDGLV
jgi:HAD superfamily hydrolase (TIGR01450 family)